MIMLRISTIKDTRSVLTVKIEGRLVSEWVPLLEKECSRLVDPHRAITLDLVDVSYVDESGLALLRRLSELSWTLSPCSSFVHQLLHQPERIL